MTKRGRIVRDPMAGPGLVMVQGRQHVFGLERVWRSDELPRPGVVVDVEFDDAGAVSAVTAVSESRLAREQAAAAIAVAKDTGTKVGAGLVKWFGLSRLAVLGLLVAGWFWLGTIEIDAALSGHWKITFWQILGALNSGRPLDVLESALNGGLESGRAPTSGLYGLAAIVCLAGPFLAHFWHDKRAHLAALLPLAFMLIVMLERPELVRPAAAKGLSLGAGAYVSALAGLYFALAGIRRFLVTKACDEAAFQKNE